MSFPSQLTTSLSLLKHGAVSPAIKNSDVVYHAVRDSVIIGHVEFKYISTHEMVDDNLTKALPLPIFKYCLSKFGMSPPVLTA